jgi:uncharacterized membrane protein
MDFSYFTNPAPFDSVGWTLLILQAGVALVGAYLAYVRADNLAFRKELVARFGLAALILGAIGLILGVLWMTGAFTLPIGIALVTLLEVILLIYAIVYRFTQYPAKLAEYQSKNSKRRAVAAKPVAQQAVTAAATPNANVSGEAVQPSRRREARRDRKRRNK